MQFTIALFAAGALASNLVARQSTGLSGDIAKIQSKTEALENAIGAYQGQASQALGINGAAADVNDAVQVAIKNAKVMPQLSQTDALALATPIQGLGAAVNKSVTALIAKKDLFVTGGLQSTVLSTLQTQSKSSEELTSAVISKIPVGLQETARNLAKPVADAFAAAIAAYSTGGSGSHSSPSSGGSASHSSPAAAASSAPAYNAPATAPATGNVTAPNVAPGATAPAPNGTNPSASSYAPEPYTGAAAMPPAAAGFGAVAIAALIAVL